MMVQSQGRRARKTPVVIPLRMRGGRGEPAGSKDGGTLRIGEMSLTDRVPHFIGNAIFRTHHNFPKEEGKRSW